MIKKYNKNEDKLKQYKKTEREYKKNIKEFYNQNKDFYKKLEKMRRDILDFKISIRRCIGVAKKFCREKKSQLKTELEKFEKDNEAILTESVLINKKRYQTRYNIYRIRRENIVIKNNIEDLPILPVYIKQK